MSGAPFWEHLYFRGGFKARMFLLLRLVDVAMSRYSIYSLFKVKHLYDVMALVLGRGQQTLTALD